MQAEKKVCCLFSLQNTGLLFIFYKILVHKKNSANTEINLENSTI